MLIDNPILLACAPIKLIDNPIKIKTPAKILILVFTAILLNNQSFIEADQFLRIKIKILVGHTVE
jgi:hypothetical protein